MFGHKRQRLKKFLLMFSLMLTVVCLFNFREFMLVFYYMQRPQSRFKYGRNFGKSFLTLNGTCECQRSTVYVQKIQLQYTVTVKNTHGPLMITNNYTVDEQTFESSIFTCNLFDSLRRGPHAKIISYSLYGKQNAYYEMIRELTLVAKRRYPDWVVRIYHDSSIDKSIICDLTCLKDSTVINGSVNEDAVYLDNIDFCLVEKLPFDTVNTWNASYMHGMTWRWLPLGDSFVDFFSSRDTDAWISTREVDSVQSWIKSNTIFHVMRDSPEHNMPIIGGLWGFALCRNRELAEHLFNVITDSFIAKHFNPAGRNLKQYDQLLLERFFAHYARQNSTTHDSYSCDRFGGRPFPTRRSKNVCFVGCSLCCDQPNVSRLSNQNTEYRIVCPEQCRPKNHPDWIYC